MAAPGARRPPSPSPAEKSPGPVRVLVSLDPYLRHEALTALVNDVFVGTTPSITRFDLSEQPLDALLAEARHASLFTPVQVLVGERLDALAAKEQAPLLDYLQAPHPHTTLVLMADKLDGRQKVTQALQKAGCVQVLTPPSAHELVGWIEARARAHGVRIASSAAAALAARVGPDVGLLHESLQKLALFVATPGDNAAARAIEEGDVAALIVPTREESIFVLTEALGEGPFAHATQALQDLLHGGEEPLVILAMLIRQLRLLLAAKDGARVAHVPPFVARKLGEQAKRLDKDILLGALSQLQAADVTLKRSGLPADATLLRAIWPLVAAATRGRA